MAVGDLDGDGHEDMVFGAPGGDVFVYPLQTGAVIVRYGV
jgi:hypothetical protein